MKKNRAKNVKNDEVVSDDDTARSSEQFAADSSNCSQKDYCGGILLNYSNETNEKVDEHVFTSILPKIAKKHPSAAEKSLDLSIVDDKKIQALNKEHRDQDKPTDVISFVYSETDDFPGENPLGEIYISIDTAKKQAEEMGHPLEHELKFLFIHGLLHLLGFTHDTEEAYEEMMKEAEELLICPFIPPPAGKGSTTTDY